MLYLFRESEDPASARVPRVLFKKQTILSIK
jgi:hypothetical protein